MEATTRALIEYYKSRVQALEAALKAAEEKLSKQSDSAT